MHENGHYPADTGKRHHFRRLCPSVCAGRTMERMQRTGLLALAVVTCFVVAVWLYTYDVDVAIDGNGGPGAGSFCGSAYDVVFLKKDGYMGGEMPPNQDRIDAACIDKAEKFVWAAGAVGALGVVLVPLRMAVRSRRRSGTLQREGPPALLS